MSSAGKNALTSVEQIASKGTAFWQKEVKKSTVPDHDSTDQQ
jgi:hypothetical protein